MARGLARRVRAETAKHARRARWQTVVLVPLIAGIYVAYSYRREFFGLDEEIRTGYVFATALLGWMFARAVGRAVAPALLSQARPRPGRHGQLPHPAAHARLDAAHRPLPGYAGGAGRG